VDKAAKDRKKLSVDVIAAGKRLPEVQFSGGQR
jgi:hypothetical protein